MSLNHGWIHIVFLVLILHTFPPNINLSNLPTSNFEAVESAKANAAACWKAPLETPKGVEGLQLCSKDMFENS